MFPIALMSCPRLGGKNFPRGLLFCLLPVLLSACFNPLMVVDGRTALEQELTRTAILRAVDQIPIDNVVKSGAWQIEVVTPDAEDADWIKSLLRQHLVSQGATISIDKTASLPVIQADVRFAGSDVDNFYVGIPLPGGGGKALSFFQSITERGRAGLGLTLWSEEGKLLGQSPQVKGSANYTDIFLLTVVGPISFTDLEDIQTSGRLVQMGKDKWVKVKQLKDWDSPPGELQD
jgi:hypothetical protein